LRFTARRRRRRRYRRVIFLVESRALALSASLYGESSGDRDFNRREISLRGQAGPPLSLSALNRRGRVFLSACAHSAANQRRSLPRTDSSDPSLPPLPTPTPHRYRHRLPCRLSGTNIRFIALDFAEAAPFVSMPRRKLSGQEKEERKRFPVPATRSVVVSRRQLRE